MSFRAGSPFETLHRALAQATERHLSDITYKQKKWYESKEKGHDVYETVKRRPDLQDVEVYMFVQGWSDTSLGFGGVAGQAFTTAYTVVVFCLDTGEYAVYHGGRFAYMIVRESRSKEGFTRFKEDLADYNLAGFTDQMRYQ